MTSGSGGGTGRPIPECFACTVQEQGAGAAAGGGVGWGGCRAVDERETLIMSHMCTGKLSGNTGEQQTGIAGERGGGLLISSMHYL